MEGIDKISLAGLRLLVFALRHMVWGESKIKRAHYLGASRPGLLYSPKNLFYKICFWMDKKDAPPVG